MTNSTKNEKSGDDKSGENLTGGLNGFKLEEEIARAKSQPSWSTGDRCATSLVKHRDFSVTLLLLRKGARLNEHSARGSISVQVAAGAIRFRAEGRDETLTPGTLCVLRHEVPHAVEALEESAVLLTASLPPQ
jgi:quercetin dioxygenase-like cupin family protein